MKVSKSEFDPRDRWGAKLVEGGFCIIPDKVIKSWPATRLDATDLAIVTVLAAYWWSSDSPPFPSAAVLGRILSLDKRTIERRVRKMKERGFIATKAMDQKRDGPKRRSFDLSGLIKFFEAV